jgi:hypothetical protein
MAADFGELYDQVAAQLFVNFAVVHLQFGAVVVVQQHAEFGEN